MASASARSWVSARAMSLTESACNESSAICAQLPRESAVPIEDNAKTFERLVQLLGRDDVSSRIGASRASDSRVSAIRSSIPASPLRIQNRTGNHLAAGVAERDQMSREISAVHRGNVFRFQRPQIAGFVPVVEVAAKKLQPIHRCERRIQPLNRFVRTRPAEIVSRDH